jgi:hypothetical protein
MNINSAVCLVWKLTYINLLCKSVLKCILLCLAQLKHRNLNVTFFCSDGYCITTNMKRVLRIMKNVERRIYEFFAQVRVTNTRVPVSVH